MVGTVQPVCWASAPMDMVAFILAPRAAAGGSAATACARACLADRSFRQVSTWQELSEKPFCVGAVLLWRSDRQFHPAVRGVELEIEECAAHPLQIDQVRHSIC